MTELDPRHRLEGYQALGHYFATFSETLGELEAKMVAYLQRHDIPADISYLPFGVMTADNVAAVFFAMAQLIREHDDKELRVAKKLRKMFRDEIAFRNDAAHGHWMIGYWAKTHGREDVTPIPPTVDRTKPGREGGAFVRRSEDLNDRAERLLQLSFHLGYYGFWSFDHGRVPLRNLVRIDDRGQIVPGPEALQPEASSESPSM